MCKDSNRAPDRFDERASKYTRARIELYNKATSILPHAREKERQLVIDQLRLSPGLTVCDVGAGGGYLSEGIEGATNGNCRIVCIENSQHFLDSIPGRFEKHLFSLHDIHLPDRSFDRIASLAGLHHLERKRDFFREAYRLLGEGGRLVVADVLAHTPPAEFLNGPVDRYTDIGHDGMFFERGELMDLCLDSGFSSVGEMYCQYTWDFPDHESMRSYCQTLFRMTKATPEEVDTAIRDHLEIIRTSRGVHLAWSLLTVSADKAVPHASGEDRR
jgi:cyclopropane fatty-acyl-phospholipid synthase-like methyltransferase